MTITQTEHRPVILPWLPAARIVTAPGRGEFFVRHHRHADDTRPTLLLLHGWTASADLQFFTAYEALAAHYSLVAIDHSGHGRGPRTTEPFSLEDAADDAAAVVRELGLAAVIAVGYSMGGPISLLLARRHPELVVGVMPQATALEWSASLRERFVWRLMLPVMGSALRSWTTTRLTKRFVERLIHDEHALAQYVPWMLGEMRRADASAIVQAGRALSRFDARSWASDLDVPAALLLTTKDRLVKPRKQRALAKALRADVQELTADHLATLEQPEEFTAAMLVMLDRLVETIERSRGMSSLSS